MTLLHACDLLAELHARGFDLSEVSGPKGHRHCRVRCSQCEALAINGLACHEQGCPHQTRECAECGAILPRRAACDCLAQSDEQEVSHGAW